MTHSSARGGLVPEFQRELAEAQEQLTERYPAGRICQEDSGQVMVGVTSDPGMVFVVFPMPKDSIGMPPAQARQIASWLLEHADAADL